MLDVHPAPVEAARDELHRLTINLIENALRHTPAGTMISVRTGTADGQAVLVVQDEGPGVPPELRADPVRALRPRRRRSRGLLRPRPGDRARRCRVARRHRHARGCARVLGRALRRPPAHTGERRDARFPRPPGRAWRPRGRPRREKQPRHIQKLSLPEPRAVAGAKARVAQTSTTTGSTIGRRFKRS